MTTAETADFVALMPTVEMHGVDTAPFPALPMDATCAWCNVRLRAIPDCPKPYAPKDTGEIAYYHPMCVGAARNADAGIRVDLDAL